MLVEQSLVNPNFIGRDSFRWFVGQVTKFKNTENGYKVKVRIIGHHPDAASVVKDEDLPWAHVLVPLNMGGGEGGTGVSFNPRGSETVIGFFADGEDGQQPIIIGSLFSGASIVHPNGWNQGTNGFNPFKEEPGSIGNPSNIDTETGKPPQASGIPNANGTITDKDGKEKRTQRQEAAKQNENTVVSTVSSCKSGNDVFSKIAKVLREFIKVLNTVNTAIDVYVNPALNLIADIPSLLSEAAQAIGDGLSEYIKFARDEIIKRIYKLLKGEIEKLLPKDLGILKKIATDKIVDGIWCAFQNILKKVVKFATDFLKQLVKTVVSVPLCAAESFVGSLTQTVTNEIQNALGPITQQIASTLGGAVGQVSSYVGKAISYAQLALSFLSCENAKCKEEFDYEMNKGYIPKSDPNFQKIISYRPATGINNLFSDGKKQAETWLGSVGAGGDGEFDPDLQGECDATIFRCGLPKVTIFGGGGSGAKGRTVVDVFGQVMGVNLLDPGSGYTTAPYVSIDDSCESGSGANAFAVIGGPNGGVTRIVVDSPGSGYLGPNDLGGPTPSDIVRNVGGINLEDGATNAGATNAGNNLSPCSVDPVDEDGKPVVGFIESIVVLSTGVGYSEDDIIVSSVCNSDILAKPKLDPSGRIVGAEIINPGTAIRVFPRLTINTENGFGAVLLPVLGFKDVETPTTETNRQLVQKVILCAEDHE